MMMRLFVMKMMINATLNVRSSNILDQQGHPKQKKQMCVALCIEMQIRKERNCAL